MANEQNLIPIRKGQLSKEEAKRRASNGGKKSVEVRKEKKLFKEAIEKQLGDSLNNIIAAMIKKASKGDVQATTFLRDTLGEKPTDKVEGNMNISYESKIKEVVDTNEY